MSENTVQIDKRVATNFRVANLSSGQMIEEQLTILRATLVDPYSISPNALSVIATLEIEAEKSDPSPYSIAYLGLSRDQNDPVVTPGSGKALGPFVTYDREITSAEPLFQHRFDLRTVRVYPHNDKLLGVWARLLPSQK